MSFRSINKDIWEPFLAFNKGYFDLKNNMPTENIKSLPNTFIPFLPIQMNPYSYNRLLSAFGYLIHGENSTFVEILHDSDKILQLTFVRSDDNGNFIEVIDNVLPSLKIEFAQVSNLESLFDTIKAEIVKLYNVDIGAIRLYHKDLITAVTDFCLKVKPLDDESSNGFTFTELFKSGSELLITVLQNDWFMTYPNVPLFTFVRDLVKKYPDITKMLREIKFPKDILNDTKFSITLRGDDWYITFILRIDDGQMKIEARPPFEFGPVEKTQEYYWTELMEKINNKYGNVEMGVSPNYIINANWLAEFMFDIFESKIPLAESRLKYLMQKLFFGYKKIEDIWDVAPRPAIYKEMVRYIVRMMGYRINPRKLSYWSLPDLLMFALVKNFGSHYRLAFLIGPEDVEQFYRVENKTVKDAYGKESRRKTTFPDKIILKPEQIAQFFDDANGFLIQYRGSEVEDFSYINKDTLTGYIGKDLPNIEEIIEENKILYKKSLLTTKMKGNQEFEAFEKQLMKIQQTPSFKSEATFKAYIKRIHLGLCENYGFVNAIFFINTKLFAQLAEALLIDINTKKATKYLRFMKVFKCMKRVDCFYVYPEVPAYHFFKKMKINAYLKMLFRMMFDNREF